MRLHSYGVDIGLDDPWFRAARPRGCWTSRTPTCGCGPARVRGRVVLGAAAGERRRISSQRWHRDFNDKHLLKAFLYLVDVDEQMGPFRYVAGSQPGGPYADAWAWRPLGENYPTETELEDQPVIGGPQLRGAEGVLVFCNTCGFHGAGSRRRTRGPRHCDLLVLASLASLTERSYRFAGSLDELDGPTRFALS